MRFNVGKLKSRLLKKLGQVVILLL